MYVPYCVTFICGFVLLRVFNFFEQSSVDVPPLSVPDGSPNEDSRSPLDAFQVCSLCMYVLYCKGNGKGNAFNIRRHAPLTHLT